MTDSLQPGSIWRPGPPAASVAVAMLAQQFPDLPTEYLHFLKREDGSEGDLGVAPGWVQLWPAAEVTSRNAAYEVQRLLPGHLGFASNGSGELLAFDTRSTPWRICVVPLVGLADNDVAHVADDFATLAREFGLNRIAG